MRHIRILLDMDESNQDFYIYMDEIYGLKITWLNMDAFNQK